MRYAVGGRADVVNFSCSGHNHPTTPIMARSIQQSGHQDLVGVQQIGLAARVPPGVLIIGIDGVPNLLNLPQRGDHRLAVENGRDLFLAERIPFDRQRAANGADAIDPPQAQVR